MTTVVFDRETGVTKEAAMDVLDSNGVDSRPFFYPLSSLPPLRHYTGGREANPVAYDISARGINLPSAMSLTRGQIDHVCALVEALAAGHGRTAMAERVAESVI
jgi:perosamine synthetase